MAQALGYQNVEDTALLETYQELLTYYNGVDPKVEFLVSNSIWFRQGEAIKPDFLEQNQTHFFAKVEELDFAKPEAADIINGWIDDSTKGLIPQMIEPPIPGDVIMYLINAIYFKGDWVHPFDQKATQPASFFAYGGEDVTVDMMYRTGPASYYQGEGYQALKMPYGQGKLSMTILLPEDDILEYISSLTEESFREARLSPLSQEEVSIWLPRFSISYGIKKLNDPLIQLGMELPFSSYADLSGIREGTYISRVLHKAVITVDETGTEAAATTVVVFTETAVEPAVPVAVDKPFLFFIRDSETGAILFMGRVLDPRGD